MQNKTLSASMIRSLSGETAAVPGELHDAEKGIVPDVEVVLVVVE